MNIPQDTLQQVADEAFLPSSKIVLTTSNIFDDWKNQAKDRRAVIQHAISNPALAPFLAGGGEYTDMEIADAWRSANHTMPFVSEIKRFLAALPRRESPALAEAFPSVAYNYPQPEWVDAPEPAAQVPLGPEDVPPGSALRSAKNHCFSVVYISSTGVTVFNPNGSRYIKWHDLQGEGWQINTSIPDSGRWDANAWRDCIKPGK